MLQATLQEIPHIGTKTAAVGNKEEKAMRKLMNIFAAALVMLAAVGCEKNETLLPDKSSKVVTLYATINNGATKTLLGTFEDNKGYPALWSEGDAIAVVQNDIVYKFNLTEGANTTSGTFTLDGTESYSIPFNSEEEIKAFYPYEGVTLEGGAVKYNIPAVQNYAENSFGNGAAPMTAYREANATENLEFTNLFGAIKLRLKGATGEKLQSVEITSDRALSGEISVTIGDATTVATYPATPDVEQKKVVLRKGMSDIAISEEENSPTVIYIPVPAESHTFSAYIITDKGAYYKKVSAVQEITAGTIKEMPVLDLLGSEFENRRMSYAENGVYIGEGIALPKSSDGQETLIWAPVNCGYDENHKYGLLYQWGRKYGQGYKNETPAPALENGQLSSAADGSLEANKNNFYTGNDNWLSSQIDDLWYNNTSGASTTKTEYDPCPAGWRVPTNAELVSLVSGLNAGEYNYVSTTGQWKGESDWDTADSEDLHYGLPGFWFYGNTTETTGNKVFFPAAGYRYYNDGSALVRGNYGYYWSSSVSGLYARTLHFYANGYMPSGGNSRAFGQSVRCVKE